MPRSDLGKIVTIIYVLPAISLSTINYLYCGKMVISLLKLVIILVETKLFKHKQIVRFQRKIIIFQFLQTVTCLEIYILFSTNFFMSNLSNLDIIYGIVIAFTTIGFGDIMYDREKFANSEFLTLLIVLQQTLFVLAFAMVASMIAAIIDALSATENTKEDGQSQCTKCSQKTLSVEEVDM